MKPTVSAPAGHPQCGRCYDRNGPVYPTDDCCEHGPRYSDQPRPGFYHPRTWADGVAPLSVFAPDRLAQIEAAVALRKRPDQWIRGEMFQMPSRAWHEWHWSRGLRLPRVPGYAPRYRRRISDDLRFAVYERDGFACLHCGDVESLTLDHIYPYSRGGEDTLENLQTLCRPCNSRKGARV